MQTKKIMVAVLVTLFLALPGTAGSAWAWGSITHLGIGQDLVNEVPVYDEEVFIPANVCPDLAWTLLFQLTRRDYVHTDEFAEALKEVADKPKWQKRKPQWQDISRAWKAHLAADAVAHGSYVPEDETLHFKVEWAVDTCLYHEGSPVTPEKLWEDYNVSKDCCDPQLIYLASLSYNPFLPVYPWMVVEALETLANEIKAEYKVIKPFLSYAVSKQLLDNLNKEDWQDPYRESVTAAANAAQ